MMDPTPSSPPSSVTAEESLPIVSSSSSVPSFFFVPSASSTSSCYSSIPSLSTTTSSFADSTSSSSSSSSSPNYGFSSPTSKSHGGPTSSSRIPKAMEGMVTSAVSSRLSNNGGRFGRSSCPYFQSLLLQIRHKIFDQIRPWSEFFAQQCFQRPNTSNWSDRVDRNLRYFRMNYVVVGTGISLLCILMNPLALVLLLSCGCLMAYVSSRTSGVVEFPGMAGTRATVRQAQMVVGGLTAVLLMVFAGSFIMTVVTVSLILVIVHAVLHVGKTYDEIGVAAAVEEDDFI